MDVVGGLQAERTRYRLDPRRPRAARVPLAIDLVLLAALAGAGWYLLSWRAGMLGRVGPAGWALFALEVLSVVWLAVTAVLSLGRTSPRRLAPLPDPETTLDILIPVAGEPLALVEATIRAAQAVRWPARVVVCNDGWMARNPGWREVEDLCRRLGVACLTRTTGPKGKAGNLNHALTWSTAEVVLTIDADHQVVPEVGQELLGWFRHDEVAFVTTPQQFHGSRRDPLNPTDPVFYRATQPARDRHGLAFSTGNGVAYRRDALVRIGGFSEWSLVEDLHTSIRLHAAGWRSVFHPRPVTVGLAPRTAAEFARQRLRWATDSMRILRHDPPWRRAGLGPRGKVLYTHTLVSHLVVMVQLGFLLGPPAWTLGRLSLLSGTDWRSQAAHIGPWLAVTFLTLAHWAGLRPALRTLRLNAAFLPAVFWVAAWRALRRQAERGTVTAKADLPRFNRLVLAGLALPALLLLTLVWGVFDPRPGGSDLAMVWAGLLAALAVGPLLKVGHRRLWPAVGQVVAVGTVLSLAAGAVATTRLGWQAPAGLYTSFRTDGTAGAVLERNELGGSVVTGPAVQVKASPKAAPVPVRALRPGTGIYVGFASERLPYDLTEPQRWAREVTEPQIVHWYQQWGSGDSRFRGDWLRAVADSGRVPMVSWEAWAKPDNGFKLPDQTLGNMADIAAGRYDGYIDSWAQAAAAFGQPLLLRPFHEMNGDWYPWSVGVNGNTAETFVAGWRHVVDRFRAAGAANVGFVWSINQLRPGDAKARATAEAAYPGHAYVDWVATSGFNWDDYRNWSTWTTAQATFKTSYDLLAGYHKPVMFSEIGTGSHTNDPVKWVADAMAWLATLPALRAVVWFDHSYDGEIDFRLGPRQQAAIGKAVATSGGRLAPPLVLVDPATPVPSSPGSFASVSAASGLPASTVPPAAPSTSVPAPAKGSGTSTSATVPAPGKGSGTSTTVRPAAKPVGTRTTTP